MIPPLYKAKQFFLQVIIYFDFYLGTLLSSMSKGAIQIYKISLCKRAFNFTAIPVEEFWHESKD